ncbi:MAG: O-antigen ligase family protein [Anaerolineae bacterium]|nr:O-antigen ligase family protein [Anaerolineae bacterium]
MQNPLRQQFGTLQDSIRPMLSVALAIGVGIGAGIIAIVAGRVELKWAAVIVIATAAPCAALLVRDIKKLILITFIIDIPLGIDVALQDQEWHDGGPTGYIVSLMTIVLIVGYALWIIEHKPKVRFFPQVTVPALLYILMSLFSFFQTRNLQLSLFGLFMHCQFFLMTFYLANHLQTWSDVRLVMTTMAICLLLEGGLMVLQYFSGLSLEGGLVSSHTYDSTYSAGATGPRVGGTIGAPNSAAAYLASTLMMVLGAYLARAINGKLALPAIALGGVALIATASRTAWGSLTLSVSLLLLLSFRTDAWKKALPLILAAGLIAGVFFGDQLRARLSAAQTDRTRPELATMARNIIDAFPLGIGENNYDQVMSDRYAHPNWVGHRHTPVHNKYLLVWAELGPQGLAAFALLLLATAWQARRWLFRKDVSPAQYIIASGFLVALVGYAFHMNTEGFASRANVQILWLIIALIVVSSHFSFADCNCSVRGTRPSARSGDRAEQEAGW